MKSLYFVLIILIISCAPNASVEFGFNDGALINGTFGDLIIQVTKIEALQGKDFIEVWRGNTQVAVSVNDDNYQSITNGYIPITPGNYKKVRLTIDSLIYKIDNTSIVLVDTLYQFIADAFTPILIEENQDYRLVISIASSNWFSPDSQRIKTGHKPFEGASLKIYYYQ
ncbi:MAG: hypothetical protein ABIL40_02010 [candidate division WOR-3 bacterium]